MQIHFFFTWVMFLGLFPFAYFWLKRAWGILIKKDYSHVALKKGMSPDNPRKFAFITGIISLIAGIIFFMVILLILVAGLDYDIWSAVVGVTFWMKIFLNFAISRYAHMNWRR